MAWRVNTAEQTQMFGQIIGEVARAGDVLLMVGELGAGKTTLTKGIAQGLGITQMVKSPTYTIIREYTTGRLPLYHMDIYRIGETVDALEMAEYFEGDGLTVVEWGNLLTDALPEDYVTVTLEKEDADKRKVTMTAIGERAQQLMTRIEQRLEAQTWQK